jgi:hypothetical protein
VHFVTKVVYIFEIYLKFFFFSVSFDTHEVHIVKNKILDPYIVHDPKRPNDEEVTGLGQKIFLLFTVLLEGM